MMFKQSYRIKSGSGFITVARIKYGDYTVHTSAAYEKFFIDYLKELAGTAKRPASWEQRDLRENSARKLFFLDVPGQGAFFVKHFKQPDFFQQLRFVFESSKAVHEFRNLLLLAADGVPAPEPVGVIEKNSGFLPDTARLFLKEIQGVKSLKDFFAGNDVDRGTAKKILDSLAVFVDMFMSRGYLHRDFHIGNILIRESVEKGVYQLFISDLHRAQKMDCLKRGMVVHSMAHIAYSLNSVLPASLCHYFVKKYCSLSPEFDSTEKFKAFAGQVAEKSAEIRHNHLQSRTRRALVNSTGFTVVKSIGYNIYTRRGTDPRRILRYIEKHDHLKDNAPMKLEKNISSRVISRITGGDDRDEKGHLYVKEYIYTFTQAFFKNFLRMHRAKSAWLSAEGFRLRGLPTPQCVGLVEKKIMPFITSGCLVTREVPNALTLSQFVVENFLRYFESSEFYAAKKHFVLLLVEFVGDIHRKGVFHYDMKANNILVQKTEDADEPGFYWLDLDRVDFERELSEQQVIKNLAQLNAAVPGIISRADRMRFFRAYQTRFRKFKDPKAVLRRIMQITIQRKHIWP